MRLGSTRAVVDKLGGVKAVAAMTGSQYAAVWNWTTFAKFPANTFCVMTIALAANGCYAPPRLWGMKQCEPERRRA